MKRLVFLCILSWMTCILPLFSQEIKDATGRIPTDSQQQVNYANFLYNQKEYYRAITEYKRYLYYFGGEKDEDFVRLQIGRSLVAGGQILPAISYWEELENSGVLRKKDGLLIKPYLSIAYLDLDEGKPYRLRAKHIQTALGIIDSMDRDEFIYKDFHRFAESFRQYDFENEKSPAVAGTLSALLPGSGSVYNERYIEGTYVFLITSLFLYATLDSYRSGQRGYVPVFAFFTLAFYGGGIYTAISGAHKQNDYQHAEYLSEQRNRYRILYDRR